MLKVGVASLVVLMALSSLIGLVRGQCTVDLQAAGLCGTASNSGSQVDISGTVTVPGRNDSPRDSQRDTPAVPKDPPRDCGTITCRDSYDVAGLPEVTLADLASFVPSRPTLRGEPDGVGVVGMPTNVVASASEQRIPGTLFDYDVVVRFVPVGFRFDYGDGAVATSSTGGASWSALGQAEFTPTPTSHVYAERGTYRVGVTVLYAASVDFGAGWRPVPGHVEATTSGYRVRIVEVHTALVEKTCIENPRGPGC